MTVGEEGFEQCYNGQAVVRAGSLLVVAPRSGGASQANDQAATADDAETRLAVLQAHGQCETLMGTTVI